LCAYNQKDKDIHCICADLHRADSDGSCYMDRWEQAQKQWECD